MAKYTGDDILSWNGVEGGNLPTLRYGLAAAVVDNVIYVTGGYEPVYPDGEDLASILSWNPSSETKWQRAGNLSVPRSGHAAVALPSSIISSECSAMIVT